MVDGPKCGSNAFIKTDVSRERGRALLCKCLRANVRQLMVLAPEKQTPNNGRWAKVRVKCIHSNWRQPCLAL